MSSVTDVITVVFRTPTKEDVRKGERTRLTVQWPFDGDGVLVLPLTRTGNTSDDWAQRCFEVVDKRLPFAYRWGVMARGFGELMAARRDVARAAGVVTDLERLAGEVRGCHADVRTWAEEAGKWGRQAHEDAERATRVAENISKCLHDVQPAARVIEERRDEVASFHASAKAACEGARWFFWRVAAVSGAFLAAQVVVMVWLVWLVCRALC